MCHNNAGSGSTGTPNTREVAQQGRGGLAENAAERKEGKEGKGGRCGVCHGRRGAGRGMMGLAARWAVVGGAEAAALLAARAVCPQGQQQRVSYRTASVTQDAGRRQQRRKRGRTHTTGFSLLTAFTTCNLPYMIYLVEVIRVPVYDGYVTCCPCGVCAAD